MNLQWVAVNLLTGAIVCDLADLELTGALATTIGQVESTQMFLHVTDSTNPDWLTGTQPGGSALIAYTGTNTTPTVVWGGIVTQRVREPGDPTVQLALSTPECYLDGCQVGTYTASNLNQDTILQGLMAFAMGSNRPAWTLNHLSNASTQTQSVSYTPSSQTSVYAALQALSAVQGGPEWMTGWTWNVAAGTITPTLTYGARIGQPVNAGAQPNVTIESGDLMPGSAFTEDYSPGMGANVVTAFGSTSGASSGALPTATAQEVDLKGRPLWTYAFTPNQTVTDVTVLASYASQAATLMQDGAQPLTMTIANDLTGKQFGLDWNLGDDIGWVIDGPAFPQPVSGVSRVVSYHADWTTITPILKGASLG
ncbi:MAG TPA: hypothetical protein VFH56_12715 [Acidimicrobiales bacterium]|nr:hypothetical protein [Acidimicrobiales bacterium]